MQAGEVGEDVAAVDEVDPGRRDFGDEARDDGVEERGVDGGDFGAVAGVVGAVGEDVEHEDRRFGAGLVQGVEQVAGAGFEFPGGGELGEVNAQFEGGEIPAGAGGEVGGHFRFAEAGAGDAVV